jgi:hypothetical protein
VAGGGSGGRHYHQRSHGASLAPARLCGAVEALQERTAGFAADQYIVHKRNLAALRSQLDPARLEVCWAAVRALDWEQAITEALDDEAPAK